MLRNLEDAMNQGIRKFHLLMIDGSEETHNIWLLGEDDIIIADDNMRPCGWIDDVKVKSFIPAE